MYNYNEEFIKNLKMILEDGIDDYWMTFQDSFMALNYVRKAIGLEEIPEYARQNMLDYFNNLN